MLLLDSIQQVELGPPRAKALHDNLGEVLKSVITNLENMLNTRSTRLDIPESYSYLQSSVINYGLPDFMADGQVSDDYLDQLCKEIELAVDRYESRLRNVQVQSVAEDKEVQPIGTLRFQINAELVISDEHISVAFNSDFEPATNSFLIKNYT